MKRAGIAIAVCGLALFLGCKPKQTVVLLKAVPEIDHSAIDPLIDYDGAEISKDRLFVIVTGTAKEDMGLSRGVRIERYTKDGVLDTIPGSILSAKEVPQPAQPPPDPNRDPNVMPPRPPMPPPPVIEKGGPVSIAIDATMSRGVITKLVITPGPAGPAVIPREAPMPGGNPGE